MFGRLIWKEWRENLWKLVFCVTVSVVFISMLFRVRLFPDRANCLVFSFVQMFVVPVIYALDIFSGEMSNRTIHLLFKFPVPRWKIFFSKYLIAFLGIVSIFLLSGLLMEAITQGREASTGFLFNINISFGAVALLIFTWFCPFGAQSRSEAGSLAALFGVVIGWSIIMLWTSFGEIPSIGHLVPYNFIMIHFEKQPFDINLTKLITYTASGAIIVLSIACWRFVKVRRCL